MPARSLARPPGTKNGAQQKCLVGCLFRGRCAAFLSFAEEFLLTMAITGSSSMLEEDDSVLDMSEQTMRPRDNALRQQRIEAWHPILDPVWVIVALFYIGVIMVPVGTLLL